MARYAVCGRTQPNLFLIPVSAIVDTEDQVRDQLVRLQRYYDRHRIQRNHDLCACMLVNGKWRTIAEAADSLDAEDIAAIRAEEAQYSATAAGGIAPPL